MNLKSAVFTAALLSTSAGFAQGRAEAPAQFAAPPQPPAPPPPPHGGPGGQGMGGPMGFGIPPAVAQKLGIPQATVVAVREATFDANEALINLEADQRRAQLELERALAASAPVEADVFSRLEAVSRTELSVRKNRVQLVLKIRKLVGPDLWTRLEAELPGRPGPLRPPPPPGEQGPR